METQHTASLGEYVAVLRRRRRLMVAVALPIVIVAVILAIALPDIYRSAAKFLLVTDSVEDSAGGSSEFADQYVISLADRVVSGGNLGRIVKEVNPYPEFGDDESLAVSELRDNVSVEMTTQTTLGAGGREQVVNTGFTVSFDHLLPEKSQQVASALARIFVEQSRTERLSAARGKIDFYKKEGERTRDEIAEFESQLADFKERNFDQLPETAQANITIRGRIEQELDSVDREIRGIQQNRVFVEQQLRQAQAGPTVNNLTALESEYASKSAIYAENHPDLVTLRRQIEGLRAAGPGTAGNTLQAQLASQRAALAEARQRYSEDHPDIRRMMGNIASLEARVAAGESPTSNLSGESLAAVQLHTQLNAMNTQLGGLQGRSGQLRSRLEQFESRLGSTPEVEREYQAITRGLGTARSQFDQMVERRMNAEVEAAAISGGAADRFLLTGEPGLPWEPAKPKRLAIIIIGLILATILALSAAVGAEAFDSRVRGGGDVRRTMGHAPLATVPQIHNSVYFNQRARRIVRLAVSILVVTPVLYSLVHFMVN
ncbi:MAG: hypothetical protein WD793_08970 [Steroidobacteraceae bacterium]